MLNSILCTNSVFLRSDASMALIVTIATLIVVGAFLFFRRQGEDSRTAESVTTDESSPVERSEPAKLEAPADIASGLQKTRSEGFVARLSQIFAGQALSPEILDEVEEVLLTSDIGVRTADRLMESLKVELSAEQMADPSLVWQTLKREASTILKAADGAAKSPVSPSEGPRITMVLGVNGTGKTTSIGKMANRLTHEGEKVTLIAGDTFRAAAAEQLEVWGKRVGADVFRGNEGADPSSVVYDGVRKALDEGSDIAFVDTAGRLHTQVNLMEELRKVRRVMGKAIDGAPHEVLMVLDATTGQNAIQQARIFNEATDVTGIILTKLDGTAKGGIVIGIADELGIPIRYVGVGERVEDLRNFDADEFVEALFAA